MNHKTEYVERSQPSSTIWKACVVVAASGRISRSVHHIIPRGRSRPPPCRPENKRRMKEWISQDKKKFRTKKKKFTELVPGKYKPVVTMKKDLKQT